MRLGSRRFERAARRLVRREVKASRELRQERQRLGSRRKLPDSIPTAMFLVMVGGLAARGADRGEPALILIALTIFSAGWAFFRGMMAMHHFYAGPELAVWAYYPVSDGDYFTRTWRKSLRSFALPAVAVFGTAYLVLATKSTRHDFRALAIAGACAALHAGAVVAAGLLLWRHYARWWKAWWISWALPIAGVTLYGVAGWAPTTISAPHGPVEALVPVGWPAAAFRYLVLENRAWDFGLSLLALGFVLTIPWTLARMRSWYGFLEINVGGTGTAEVHVEAAVERGAAALAGAGPATTTDRADARFDFVSQAEDRVRSRAFLAPPDTGRLGLIEAAVTWILTPRERTVSGFLHGASPRWSRAWAWSALVAAAATCLMAVFPGRTGTPVFLIVIAVAAITCGVGFPGFRHPGFRLVEAGPIGLPVFATYPVAFGESVSVLLKSHAVRCVAMAPVAVAIGVAGAAALKLEAARGAGLGLSLVALLLAVGPLIVVFRFVDLTRDASRLRWQGALMILLAVPACLAVPAAAIMVFLAPSIEAVLIAIGGQAALSTALLAVFGGFLRSGRRDFLRPLTRDSL